MSSLFVFSWVQLMLNLLKVRRSVEKLLTHLADEKNRVTFRLAGVGNDSAIALLGLVILVSPFMYSGIYCTESCLHVKKNQTTDRI